MKVEDMEGKLAQNYPCPHPHPLEGPSASPHLKITDLALYTCASCEKGRFMDPTPDISII